MKFQNERFLVQSARYLKVDVDYLRRFTRAEIFQLIEDCRKEKDAEFNFWHRKFAELFVILISSNGFRKKGARLPKPEDFMPKQIELSGGIKLDKNFSAWLRTENGGQD